MENFSTLISFDNYPLWAKTIRYQPPPQDCASTCTSLSHSSHISPSFFNMEREDDEHSQLSQFHPNSPADSEDFDGSMPEESIYTNDGSFDERFQDTFTDLLVRFDESKLQCEEDGQQQVREAEDIKEGIFFVDSRRMERQGMSASNHGKLLVKSWNMIRKLFLKYLGTQEAARIIKEETQGERMLSESGMKNIYRALRKQAKKISRGDVMDLLDNNRINDAYMNATNELFGKLFADFIHEKAAYALSGMYDLNRNVKKMMADIIVTLSRSLDILRR